jgi:dihydroorotate dehydrogenase
MNLLQQAVLLSNHYGYQQARKYMFKLSAQKAHNVLLTVLTKADASPRLIRLARWINEVAFTKRPVGIGGVALNYPFIVAAGLVKGMGFVDETEGMGTLHEGENIIPGWRSLPALVGPVEFGSFTRYPRLGNEGEVLWRDVEARSLQNRIGLKNPGALVAALFLEQHKNDLPDEFGINIAVSPGVSDPEQVIREVCESFTAFIRHGVIPTWFTLNVSCPNTEDDPQGNQTEEGTHKLCEAVIAHLKAEGANVPLWVKISPDLSAEQYLILMRVFQQTGVKAVIATNTLPQPSPDNPQVNAGMSGLRLHQESMTALAHLKSAQIALKCSVDIIGCGGLMDGATYRDFQTLKIDVVQYWSALVFRGPLAAPLIEREFHSGYDLKSTTRHRTSPVTD